jgi:hypothetical protein
MCYAKLLLVCVLQTIPSQLSLVILEQGEGRWDGHSSV